MGECSRPAVATVLTLMLLAPACGLPPPDPNNELPFGFVDIPQDGEVVKPRAVVAGWALDDSGIDLIRVYVDGRYRVSTAPSVPRPDVSAVFPAYRPGEHLHGWLVEIDLPEGPHHILAQAVDDEGATRDIGQVDVTAALP